MGAAAGWTTTTATRRWPSATGVDLDTPWRDLPSEQRDLFLYGTDATDRHALPQPLRAAGAHYRAQFEGILANLERRYAETESDFVREKIEEYMSERPCPECHGARLKPRAWP